VKAEELDRLGALNKADKLPLGPAPLDEEWLPKAAVMILVDLMVVMFKDCYIRINAGIDRAKGAIPVLSCVNVSIVLLMILKLCTEFGTLK
jgi:MAternally-affected-uncoordination protein